MFDNVINDEFENDFEDIDLPWIIFKVSKNTYAVNSTNVLSITGLEEEITAVPNIQSYIRGLVNFRGNMIPLIDLKKVFKEDSLDKIVTEYSAMIVARKNDHINWTNELDKCIKNGEQFGLAVDPHDCAFGKWFYSYNPENNLIAHHIKKIEEPHRLLHLAAAEYNNCNKDHANCNREECLKDVLERVKHEYMPEIINILDSSITILKDNLKELLIVVEYNGFKAGLIVDSVSSIEAIPSMYGQGNMNNEYYNTKLISSIGKTEKSQTTVLMLDIEGVLSKIEDIDMQKIELPKEYEDNKETEETREIELLNETEPIDENELYEQLEIGEELEDDEVLEPITEEQEH
jgi:purine-binding chemotaxis protein CheW